MRSFFYACALTAVFTTASFAQLLGGPGPKPDGKAGGNNPPPSPPAANAKAGVGVNAGPGGTVAAPQGNAMFSVIDTDGDGVISKAELRKAIKALQSLDTDGDGNITLAEASIDGGPMPLGGIDPQLNQLMALDKNKDNKLTLDEIPANMMPMLQNADRNGDGALDQTELQAVVAGMRNQFGGGAWRGGNQGLGGMNAAQQATGQFMQYDRNGDGILSADELPPQARGMLQGADRNGDGNIDAGELQAAIAQQGGRARALRGGVDTNDPRDGQNGNRGRRPFQERN